MGSRRCSDNFVSLADYPEVYLMTLKVSYSKNTIGCRVGNEIFVHPELHKEPELYKAVLAHEAKHTEGFKTKDFVLDLFNDDLKGHKKAYYKFMLKHPRTMLGFLPISKVGPYWGVDLTIMTLYVVVGVLMFLIGRAAI